QHPARVTKERGRLRDHVGGAGHHQHVAYGVWHGIERVEVDPLHVRATLEAIEPAYRDTIATETFADERDRRIRTGPSENHGVSAAASGDRPKLAGLPLEPRESAGEPREVMSIRDAQETPPR